MTTTTINPEVNEEISEENYLTNLQNEMNKMCEDLHNNVEKEHANLTAIYRAVEVPSVSPYRDSFISVTERMLDTLNKKEFTSYENKTILSMLNTKMTELKSSDFYQSKYLYLTPKTRKLVKEVITALKRVEDASSKKLNELDVEHIKNKRKYEFAERYDEYNSYKVKEEIFNRSRYNIPILDVMSMISNIKENANDSSSELKREEPEVFANLNEKLDAFVNEMKKSRS